MRKALGLTLLVLILGAAGTFLFGQRHSIFAAATPPVNSTVSGIVEDAAGPIAGATVQVMGQPQQWLTAADGSFTITGLAGTEPLTLTAWSGGYYVGTFKLDPSKTAWKSGSGVRIKIEAHFTSDNFKYAWITAEGGPGSKSCNQCHREFEEWQADAHSQSATNERFIAIYRGSDVNGNKGPLTTYDRDGTPVEPAAGEAYYGAGYRLDNPQRAGNCATCHTPAAGKISNRQNCGWSGCHTDLTAERSNGVVDYAPMPVSLMGAAEEGISCDFCHKIGDVVLDPETNLPRADMPGILSLEMKRPEKDAQIFFGTLKDVSSPDTYLGLLEESEYCAACHYGVFGGVVGHGVVRGGTLIYNSYGEWLDSPYSDPESGKSCQDCHMPKSDANYSVFKAKGGLERDYADFHEHTMPGVSDEAFMQNAVSLSASVQRTSGQVQLEVRITNDNTGHHVPTDAPTRQMILVVEAVTPDGKTLTLAEGPLLPDYAGNYSGRPGKVFSKLLRDDSTGEAPTAAYWRPVTILEDTRIAALATDTTRYTFQLPDGQKATLQVRLYFRRTYQKLADQKGFTDPDLLMEEATIQVEK